MKCAVQICTTTPVMDACYLWRSFESTTVWIKACGFRLELQAISGGPYIGHNRWMYGESTTWYCEACKVIIVLSESLGQDATLPKNSKGAYLDMGLWPGPAFLGRPGVGPGWSGYRVEIWPGRMTHWSLYYFPIVLSCNQPNGIFSI